MRDNVGNTSLHIASLQGHAQIVEVLLEAKRCGDKKQKWGYLAQPSGARFVWRR